MNLAGALPQGEANGLAAIGRDMVEQPDRVRVVIALIDCSKITTNTDSGDTVATARIRRIEAISDPADGHTLRRLLVREYERRTGKAVLPFEMEQDINDAFGAMQSGDDE